MTDAQLQNIFDQIGHFLGAYSVVLTIFIFHVPYWLYISALGVTIWAIGKEFWYDEHYEDAAVRGSSLLDFTFYMVGLAAGIAVCLKD